ncbi:MAG TPA: hypothetical protein VG125_08645 [Pirellulales bacterium]|nr:hypothetical protein [Pirellulales bacterium]
MLAVKGNAFGRRTLEQVATIVTPDAILRLHRELIAEKWNHSDKCESPGRPRVAKEIEELVLRMAKENPTWGYEPPRQANAVTHFPHGVCRPTLPRSSHQVQRMSPRHRISKRNRVRQFLRHAVVQHQLSLGAPFPSPNRHR